jgi:hypothetical protein
MRITRNMSELDRLRKLLMTKRDRFKSKLESVSHFSSALVRHIDSLDIANLDS